MSGPGGPLYSFQLRSSMQYRTEILGHVEAYVADPETNAWRLAEIKNLQSRLVRATFADQLTPHGLAWVDRWVPPVAVKAAPAGTAGRTRQ